MGALHAGASLLRIDLSEESNRSNDPHLLLLVPDLPVPPGLGVGDSAGRPIWFPISSHAVTDKTDVGSLAPYDASQFDFVVSFITARIEPLRRKTYDTDLEPALVGLLDIVHSIWGAADAKLARGERAAFELHQLHLIARQWREHVDYRAEWAA